MENLWLLSMHLLSCCFIVVHTSSLLYPSSIIHLARLIQFSLPCMHTYICSINIHIDVDALWFLVGAFCVFFFSLCFTLIVYKDKLFCLVPLFFYKLFCSCCRAWLVLLFSHLELYNLLFNGTWWPLVSVCLSLYCYRSRSFPFNNYQFS